MSVSGSGRKTLLDGVSYNVAADGNMGRKPTQENEGVVHSGGVSKKVTKTDGAIEGHKLIVTDIEYEQLQALSERVDNFPMSTEKADGTSLKAKGFISLGNHEAEENSCEIMMTPETGSWDTFSA